MNTKSILLAAGLSVLLSGAAAAATFTFTEGNGQNRALVKDSIDLEDANNSAPGFDLNSETGVANFSAGDVLQIHGRIVGATDTFTYAFTSSTAINVGFDFDGYDLDAGGSVAAGLSGLVNQQAVLGNEDLSVGGKGVTISLFDSSTNTQIGTTQSFTSNIVSTTDAFGIIFGNVSAGSYHLIVDGSGGPKKGTPALYDLKVAAVPLPAPALLLLAGLGGLAVARRRKKA